MSKKVVKQLHESIINSPNFLTLIRVVLTVFLIYMFIFDFSVASLLLVFIIAAMTDFWDGQIARGWNLVTNFGAKFDMIADRFLWLTFGLGVLIFFPLRGIFDGYHVFQMIMIFSREILCFPFLLINLFRRKQTTPIVHRWSGKTATFLQAFAIPILILSAYLPYFSFSIVLSAVVGVIGIWCAFDYVRDIEFFE
jgi:CDP-diacylglycerol--glycerol-3-phosphate 3-phosphatidyltransferase